MHYLIAISNEVDLIELKLDIQLGLGGQSYSLYREGQAYGGICR